MCACSHCLCRLSLPAGTHTLLVPSPLQTCPPPDILQLPLPEGCVCSGNCHRRAVSQSLLAHGFAEESTQNSGNKNWGSGCVQLGTYTSPQRVKTARAQRHSLIHAEGGMLSRGSLWTSRMRTAALPSARMHPREMSCLYRRLCGSSAWELVFNSQ